MDDVPAPRKVTELAALKAFAHPRRRHIIEYLAEQGPATSAGLARALDMNTGATSYHLRELARHGFVEEVPVEGAHGRERWWSAPRQDLRFPPRSEQDPATRAVMEEMAGYSLSRDVTAFQEASRAMDPSDPWADAFPFSRGAITVTPQELAQFFEEYIGLLKRYQRPPEETPSEARVVFTHFLGYPAPARPDGGERDSEEG
ncbi:ArsR/SmtB family transcription factor [Nocardiopsis chromatogenes]|uniref:ArsR/SmtB family transcription factor n=1 Tax=Nocardiopsis chromatogenes TaxID=280239 RepID=UPI00034BD850|nr:helix-turn-helix domain-containing protein [Nocardiopsis chromatogenes]